MKYNFPDIKTTTFTKIIVHPTGIPHIKGYINNEEDSTFDAPIGENGYNQKISFTLNKSPEGFGKSSQTLKSVSEIEDKENKQEQQSTLPE